MRKCSRCGQDGLIIDGICRGCDAVEKSRAFEARIADLWQVSRTALVAGSRHQRLVYVARHIAREYVHLNEVTAYKAVSAIVPAQ